MNIAIALHVLSVPLALWAVWMNYKKWLVEDRNDPDFLTIDRWFSIIFLVPASFVPVLNLLMVLYCYENKRLVRL